MEYSSILIDYSTSKHRISIFSRSHAILQSPLRKWRKEKKQTPFIAGSSSPSFQLIIKII